jgi:3-hydroxybutyryl-CoA dehydrogenase
MKKVLVLGEAKRLDEFRKLALQNAEVSYLDQFFVDFDSEDLLPQVNAGTNVEASPATADFGSFDVVFDLSLDDNNTNLENYAFHPHLVVFGCAVKHTLAELVRACPYDLECKVFGLNAFPTFIHRNLMEVSCLEGESMQPADLVLKELGIEYELVDDRIGMIAARVVCMIINEACFVLGEGTADVAAVDNAMKLGTNYPFGPFEWADKIGIDQVFELLDALHLDTGDSRYKVAPALRKHQLRDRNFVH